MRHVILHMANVNRLPSELLYEDGTLLLGEGPRQCVVAGLPLGYQYDPDMGHTWQSDDGAHQRAFWLSEDMPSGIDPHRVYAIVSSTGDDADDGILIFAIVD